MSDNIQQEVSPTEVGTSETKPRSFRLSDKTMDMFKDIATEIGGNQQQTLARLIETYRLEKGKSLLLSKQEDIEAFQQYTSLINRMYIAVLNQNETITERVRTQYIDQIEQKDDLIETMQSKNKNQIQEQTKLEHERNELKKQVEELSNTNSRLAKELEDTNSMLSTAINSKDDIIVTLKGNVSDSKNQIADLTKQLKNATTLAEDYNTRLHTSEDQKRACEDNLKNTEAAYRQLEEQYKNLKESYENKIAFLTADCDKKLESYKKESEYAQRIALLEANEKYDANLEELQLKYHADIDEYQSSIRELLAQLNSSDANPSDRVDNQ